MADDGSGEQPAVHSMRSVRWAAIAGGVVAAGIVVALVISSHAEPSVVACPAVGHIEVIDVNLTGPPSSVASVEALEVCGGDGCSELPGSTPTPDPTDGLVHGPPFTSTRVSASTWRIVVSDSLPDQVAVTALTASGARLVDQRFDLAWTRQHPGDQCDLSEKTAPVSLRIP